MAIGVAVASTTKRPPPRSVMKPKRLLESTAGQIGQLIGRRVGSSHGRPLGVVQVSRSSVAAGLWTKVLVAKLVSMRSSRLPFWLATRMYEPSGAG
jgi:hypothetical protein